MTLSASALLGLSLWSHNRTVDRNISAWPVEEVDLGPIADGSFDVDRDVPASVNPVPDAPDG